MNNVWLGIDTSNYTTSVSAVVSDGTFFNIKKPLCVKPHERGVRQSDAVFMHVKNLPEAMSDVMKCLEETYSNYYTIKAVGVSTKPRPVDGSYMPCFLSGVSVASALSSALNVPLYEFSHQEGHIRAALYGAHIDIPDRFYSFHLSGGTCELLETVKDAEGFKCEIISESLDITLGQLVDRVGVMMGLPFPSGPHLETLALNSRHKKKIVFSKISDVNLSGFENKAIKMYEDNTPPEEIASFVYDVIVSAVSHMLEQRKDYNLPIVFSGGVSGSTILNKAITKEYNAFFTAPSLSSDNAVGIAVLTKEKYEKVFLNV